MSFINFSNFGNLHKREDVNLSNFYTRYTELCAKCGYSPSGAAAAIGLSNAAANGWKKGKVPSDVNLVKLANLFECSVEDLTGEKKKTTTETGDGLSVEKKQLIDALISMSPEDLEKKRAAILAILDL